MHPLFHVLLFVSFLINCNDAVFKVQLHHRESLRTKITKNGNLTELKEFMHFKNKLKANAFSNALSVDEKKQGLRDNWDMEYLGLVSVGTPMQTFKVVMDTGSANFWIPDTECSKNKFQCKRFSLDEEFCEAFSYAKCCPSTSKHAQIGEWVDTCFDHKKFNASASSTFKPLKRTFSIAYGTGDCSGKVGEDTIAFGNETDTDALVVTNAYVGRTTILGNFFAGKEIEGILGLGFYSLSASSMTPPFVQAYKSNLVKQPIFTVYMYQNGYKRGTPGGQITFGGFDSENCRNEIHYVPLSQASYWKFHVDYIRVNDGQAESNQQKGFEVISDTGTSFLLVPYNIYRMIVQGTSSDNYGSFAKNNCNNKVRVDLKINGRIFTMTEKELYIEDRNGGCTLAVEASEQDFWILGDPWIRSYCQVHDMGKERIGFAPPLH